MDLILWRHAEAEDSYPDHARELTDKGQEQAKKMAKWLNHHLPENTRILVSPAVRAQQTAKPLELPYKTLESLSPGSSAQEILHAAGWTSAKDAVLIVGHQPALGVAAAIAITGKPHYWCIKKGAIWWITTRHRSEVEQAIIKAVLTPDLV